MLYSTRYTVFGPNTYTHTIGITGRFVCVINHTRKVGNVWQNTHFAPNLNREPNLYVSELGLTAQSYRCNHDWNAWNSNFQFKLEGIYVQTLSIWLNYSNLSNLIVCAGCALCIYKYSIDISFNRTLSSSHSLCVYKLWVVFKSNFNPSAWMKCCVDWTKSICIRILLQRKLFQNRKSLFINI